MEFTYYGVEQVSEMLGRSRDWVWAQCRECKIPHHRIGRSYRFTADDLKQLMANTAVVPIESGEDMLLSSRAERRLRRNRAQ